MGRPPPLGPCCWVGVDWCGERIRVAQEAVVLLKAMLIAGEELRESVYLVKGRVCVDMLLSPSLPPRLLLHNSLVSSHPIPPSQASRPWTT